MTGIDTSAQSRHQAEYWDAVADQIQASDAPNKDLVGYHSPYDEYVRQVTLNFLDGLAPAVPQKHCIAELGSGAGLNIRYFSRYRPTRVLAFDCSSHLLALARANLSEFGNVEYIQTSGFDLPVPPGAQIDLLYTVTVLQHIADPAMFQSVASSIIAARPHYILAIEDTRRPGRLVTPDYRQRTPQDYIEAFTAGGYTLASSRYTSLTWAARLFGLINRIFGLYKQQEGARVPRIVFALTNTLFPVARMFDAVLPGRFGLSGLLFELKQAP
ncbi:MAG TPA: class I SAM-dependent methyltransferase [Rhizomicrobium sp.]|nr:class I SAM-dependent methyltransferase [Rhizomicrobium sp.]